MAKRKRREKKPKEEPAALPETNEEIPTGDSPKPGQEDFQVSTGSEPAVAAASADKTDTPDAVEQESQPRKKRKKNKPTPVTDVATTEETPLATNADLEASEDTSAPREPPSKSRYILFIGNLPFNTTTASIQTHFAALAPHFTVRHSTDKATGKSRGFAFLEFENDEVMRRCLKVYHHSMFYADPAERPAAANRNGMYELSQIGEDGIHPSRLQRMAEPVSNARPPKFVPRNHSSKDKGRRINIELTAGGGGGSTSRKQKLKEKNEKLDKERERIKNTQMKLKERTDANRLKRRQNPGGTGANAGVVNKGGKRKFAEG